jgi:hypothetical protein
MEKPRDGKEGTYEKAVRMLKPNGLKPDIGVLKELPKHAEVAQALTSQCELMQMRAEKSRERIWKGREREARLTKLIRKTSKDGKNDK